MSNQFLDAAIEYASKGMAVFPLKVRGKEPMTAHGVKNATQEFDHFYLGWHLKPLKFQGVEPFYTTKATQNIYKKVLKKYIGRIYKNKKL